MFMFSHNTCPSVHPPTLLDDFSLFSTEDLEDDFENSEESVEEDSEEDQTETSKTSSTQPPYSLIPPPPVWVQRNQGLSMRTQFLTHIFNQQWDITFSISTSANMCCPLIKDLQK